MSMIIPHGFVLDSVKEDMDKKEYLRQWKLKNAEKVKAAKKRWDAENKERKAQHDQEYYERHTAKVRVRQAKYRSDNLEECRQRNKNYREENKGQVSKIKADWFQANKNVVNAKRKARRLVDPAFRISSNMRARIRNGLLRSRNGKALKLCSTLKILGCSWDELKVHLEKLWLPGMSWNNYGEWHIDHIVPCCKFNMHSLEEQAKCFYYTNLQPLWAKDNLAKGGR